MLTRTTSEAVAGLESADAVAHRPRVGWRACGRGRPRRAWRRRLPGEARLADWLRTVGYGLSAPFGTGLLTPYAGTVTKGLKFTHGAGEFTSPHARHVSDNGTRALVFEHTVVERDEDTDGLTVLAGNDGGWGGTEIQDPGKT